MENKEIYIDGIDVSGCEHFSGTYAKECKAVYANSGYKELHDLKCNKSPDCYYKQLKRKEQECEGLKNIINEAKNSKLDLNSFFAIEATIGEYCLELDRLKAKNDELMKQHQADKGLITSTGKQNYQLLQEYDKLKTENETYKKMLEDENVQLALTEIRTGERHLWFNKAEKLSKTLTEIKEIAEKAKKDICNNCGWRNTDSCDPEDYTCGEFIKILQKISEVENG